MHRHEIDEVTTKALKDKFVIGREIRKPDGIKTLWLMSYDPESKTFSTLIFNSTDALGVEWKGTWDQDKMMLTSKQTDIPEGWTSESTTHFSDNNSRTFKIQMRDAGGAVVFDLEGEKQRQSADDGKKTLAAWSKMGEPPAPVPPEMKVLEKMVGKWTGESVSKAAEWTPKEIRKTETVERRLVLDGRFVLSTGDHSTGEETLVLSTYDPGKKAYLTWWFDSEGRASKTSATWDKDSKTLNGTSDLPKGVTARTTIQFIDDDTIEWTMIGKGADGKVYVDRQGTMTRSKD